MSLILRLLTPCKQIDVLFKVVVARTQKRTVWVLIFLLDSLPCTHIVSLKPVMCGPNLGSRYLVTGLCFGILVALLDSYTEQDTWRRSSIALATNSVCAL